VFRIIHDFFAAVFPGDIVLVNEVDVSGESLITRDVIGADAELLWSAERVTGSSIKGHTYALTPAYRAILVAGRMQRIDGVLPRWRARRSHARWPWRSSGRSASGVLEHRDR